MRCCKTDSEYRKTNVKDFVTVADIKSQDMLRNNLAAVYPSAVIVSEEDNESVRQDLYASNCTGYVLDPIDGTYNFARDMRELAISIGYIEHGQIVAGVVYDPYKEELYEAEQGKGARRNGHLIRVSEHTLSVEQALPLAMATMMLRRSGISNGTLAYINRPVLCHGRAVRGVPY